MGAIVKKEIVPTKQIELSFKDKDNILFSTKEKIYNTWFQNIDRINIQSCPDDLQENDCGFISQFFKIIRFVNEKNESNRDKLITIFKAVANFNCAVIVLINSDGTNIDFYFGTRLCDLKNIDSLSNASNALEKTLCGNFPGTEIKRVIGEDQFNKLLNFAFINKKIEADGKYICTVTGIAGVRSKDESPQKLFVQGMEKLIDSMQGERYSLLVIADPVPQDKIYRMRDGYEELASNISILEEVTITHGTNKNEGITTNFGVSLSHAVNASLAKTLAYTKNETHSHASGKSGEHWHENDSNGTGNSRQESLNEQHGNADQYQLQAGSNIQTNTGENESIQLKAQDFNIKELQKKIAKHLERINTSADLGMWNCATYCLADNEHTASLLASLYQSLLRGEGSSIELSSIYKWNKDESKAILPWLRKMNHPIILTDFLDNNFERITLSSCVHSSELSIHAGIPQHSVSGLPVLEMVSFGRDTILDQSISTDEYDNLQLGNIHHLGRDEKRPVFIDSNKISEHVFITGTTGSGKSNTTYHLINELMKKNVKFLVVEPAKGEYKDVLGGFDNVEVYGTNEKITKLLRINPFSFPDSINVIEHIERLIEVFNICWPMEQAMPAVLKKAVINAYEKAGWDMDDIFKVSIAFPTFDDVRKEIRKVLKESEYSEEIKGNYIGALVTRLESLTNGIYSKIFTKREIDNKELFDGNVIIDLSRIGSGETKSLIMGILMIKLHEYRIDSRSNKTGRMNEKLKHITILEEAHNLLRRTSFDRASNSSNIAAKAVEMLSNAIAEMRTYGEGFVIVDQAPGLLDMSVIRNTNTKIIHNLPDKNDRELVGLAAMLSEDQVKEIARLQRGVAAVYQSNWVEPVLCRVTKFPKENYRPFKHTGGVKQ